MKYRTIGFALTAAMLLSSPNITAMAEVPAEVTSVSYDSLFGSESIMQPILISYQLYADVTGHWSNDAVSFLAGQDAISWDSGVFSPYQSITKGEFSYMLAKAMDIHMEYFVAPNAADYFDDLDGDAVYSNQVIDLVTAGVFEAGGDFNGDATITREEMIHYLMKAYQYLLGDNYPSMSIMMLATFDDADQITPIYNDDIARAQQAGLIKGKNNLFHPQGTASRGDAAIVIYRLSSLLAEEMQDVRVTPDAVLNNDSIQVSIKVTNPNTTSVYLNSLSGKVFDYVLLDEEQNVLYQWSADRMFTDALMTTEIAGKDELVFTDTLSGDAFEAIKDKIAGLRAYVTVTDDFIDQDGYYIEVQ